MRIGILQTGHAPDALRPTRGDYDAMFAKLLAGHGFDFQAWDVEGMVLPSSVHEAEGWLITGSRHGAYEDHPWIPPLTQFIQAAAAARVPMVGICFGHQIIAQAMGGEVVKSDKGWCVGHTLYDWPGQGPVAMNAWHQDQVITVPEGAHVVARSEQCEIAALAYGDQFLTIQAHPEFDGEMVRGLVEHRGAKVPEPLKAEALAASDQPTQSAWVAETMAAFLKAERA